MKSSTRQARNSFFDTANVYADAVFPRRCAGAIETSAHCEIWCDVLFCAACATTLHRVEAPLCACCGAPIVNIHAAKICKECRDNRYHTAPPFEAARAVFDYSGAIRSAIHKLKYDGKTALAAPLAGFLIEFLQTSSTRCCEIDEIDLITTVPLHRWRQWRRGFNQSELLSREVGRHLKKPSREVLRRTRLTPPQVEMSREERLQNVRNVFATRENCDLKGATILLIDDVYTTGATLKECAQVLKNAGAQKIFALTLARADK